MAPKGNRWRHTLRGHRTEHCRTPHTMLATTDMTSSISTRCDRSEKYNFKNWRALPVIPIYLSNITKLIQYHGQLCQMPLINLVEPDMTRFPFQPW